MLSLQAHPWLWYIWINYENKRLTKELSKHCILAFHAGNVPVTSGFPAQRASNAVHVPMSRCNDANAIFFLCVAICWGDIIVGKHCYMNFSEMPHHNYIWKSKVSVLWISANQTWITQEQTVMKFESKHSNFLIQENAFVNAVCQTAAILLNLLKQVQPMIKWLLVWYILLLITSMNPRYISCLSWFCG